MAVPISGVDDWTIFVLGLTTGALARPDMRDLGMEIVEVAIDMRSFVVRTPGGPLRVTVQPETTGA